MYQYPQETADLVSFTKEIVNRKLQFCAVKFTDYWKQFLLVTQNKLTGWNVNLEPIKGGKGEDYGIQRCLKPGYL